jgi:uncharacterized protein YcbX
VEIIREGRKGAMIQIASLHIYPVKSCRAIDLTSFDVGPRGPLYDREWMIADDETGKFVSQREFPLLATITPRLSQDSLDLQFANSAVRVSLHHSIETSQRQVRVWNDDCNGLDEGDLVAEAFSDLLSRKVRLVRMAPTFERLLPEKYDRRGSHTGFADGFPFLLTSIESLDDLNAKLPSPAPMARFRANIVISGASAFLEDTWKQIQIGPISFALPKPCARCVIVNTDQVTGARSPEVLKTLATYRTSDRKVLFGQNLIHLAQGRLRVGDKLDVFS